MNGTPCKRAKSNEIVGNLTAAVTSRRESILRYMNLVNSILLIKLFIRDNKNHGTLDTMAREAL